MKNNYTLNKRKNYLNTVPELEILRNSKILNNLASCSNKVILALFLLLNIPLLFGQNTSCNAELNVYNGTIRNTPLDGTYYSITLTNTGSSTDVFLLSTVNVNNTCSNSDGSSNSSNIILNTAILDTQDNLINQITVDSGQSQKFYIHITVPPSTALNKWCCTQLIAESKNCSNYKTNIILHTSVVDSSKDQ